MLNVILKKMKASFRDVIIEETHMKEKYETKNNQLVFNAQNLTSSSTKVETACSNNVEVYDWYKYHTLD